MLKPKETEAPLFSLGNTQPIGRVDPRMPVIIPPADDSTQFPIKVIKDFPSDMPVANLPDSSPFDEAVKPKALVEPRDTLPRP